MIRKKRSASWQEQAEALKAEAKKLPYGKEREALEMKARQLEMHPKLTSDIVAGPTTTTPVEAKVVAKGRQLRRPSSYAKSTCGCRICIGTCGTFDPWQNQARQ